MELQVIIVSEINHIWKNVIRHHSFAENKKVSVKEPTEIVITRNREGEKGERRWGNEKVENDTKKQKQPVLYFSNCNLLRQTTQ